MQLYPEGNLSELLKNVKLNAKQLKDIIRGILEGLQYLHSQNRIHRDFKPSNILVTKLPNGSYRPLIADFGLTKVVGENDYVEGSDVELSDGRGTASYKAPEQIEGEKAHYNLDLWAFGVILYEIITGDRPFKRGDKGSEQSRMTVLFDQIKSVQIPEQINTIPEPYQAIIRRCLVKDIHDRVRKEDELLDLLDGVPKNSENVAPPIPLSLEDEARNFFDLGEWDLAMAKYAEILTKDNKNKVAQQGIKACMSEIEKLEIEEEKTDNKFEEVKEDIKVNDREEIKSSLWESDSNVRIGVLVVVVIFFILVYVGIKETNRNNYHSSSNDVDTTVAVDTAYFAVDTVASPYEEMSADTTKK
jgi:eukaryotic-like serine/threonine-protein kinase